MTLAPRISEMVKLVALGVHPSGTFFAISEIRRGRPESPCLFHKLNPYQSSGAQPKNTHNIEHLHLNIPLPKNIPTSPHFLDLFF